MSLWFNRLRLYSQTRRIQHFSDDERQPIYLLIFNKHPKMKSIFFQVSMANLSATSVASAVVTTVALITSILSLAVDRWGQFNIPTLIGESKVRLIFPLCPLVKLLEGNVLCRVCLSVCSQGGVIHWTSLYRAHPLDIRHGTLPALPLLDIRHGSPQPWPHPLC